MVTKAESGPEISQMGGRQAGGQMGFLFQNVQSEGTLLTTLLFYTKSELRRNQGPVRVFFFLELTCVISLINFACLYYPFAAFFNLRPLLGALSITQVSVKNVN